MSLKVYFNNQPIKNGEIISYELSQKSILITYDLPSDSLYTIIVYDVSAPSGLHPVNSPYLHYLESNIINKQSGDEISSYVPPEPPKDSGIHIYIIEIYEQKKKIPKFTIVKREQYRLDRFINGFNLKLVDRFIFQVTLKLI